MTEPSTDARSAGALLRAAREKQGLHIAALAAAIKVSQRKLEALEGDRVDELPDATFTRALAQAVCRTLKIDARPVLDLLPPATPVVLEPTNGGLNAPFRERPGREDPGLTGVALRPLVLGAVFLMLAAGAVYLAPPGLFSRTPTTPAVALPSPPPPSAEVPPPVMVQAPMVVAPAASEPMPATPQAEPAAIAAAAAASQAAVPSLPAAPPPSGVVQLHSKEASWVEARDGRGQVLLFRTVLPGESVGLDGALPIRLTIGNAASTQLAFRGQPIDLAPRTRDNVARVELQ